MKDEKLRFKLNDAEEAISKVEQLIESDGTFEQLIDALAETRAFIESAGWLLISRELHNCMGSETIANDERVIDVIRKLLGSPAIDEGAY